MTDPSTGRRRALVTGATGYIGSRLARRLVAKGWAVHVVARKSSRLDALRSIISSIVVHEHDGTTRNMIELVADSSPNCVFHLASLFLAQHQPDDVEALIGSNVVFATQLAEAMAANSVRFLINTGTSWQHFDNAEYNPVNLYAATKQAFEDVLGYYVNSNALTVTTLSLFDTYGPEDPRSKLMTLLWKTAESNEPLLMSPGGQYIDLVHVDDVVEAYLLAAAALLEQEIGHAHYGVSSGQPLRLVDIVALFERATGLTLPITWGGRPYRTREVMRPWNRYQPVPNWQPRIPLEEGILQTRPAICTDG